MRAAAVPLLLASMLGSACVSTLRAPARVVLPQSVSESDSSIHWYDIEGTSRLELREALDRLGPVDAEGRRHDAYTEWLLSWRLPLANVEGGCVVQMVETNLRVTVRFPRWSASPDGNEQLLDAWTEYLDALWLHESGHREEALKAASKLAESLPRLPPQNSCAEAETVANAAAKEIVMKHRDAERRYDEETQHGAMQGASFPGHPIPPL